MVVKAVQIKKICSNNDPRYIVVDVDTHKIVLAGKKYTGYHTTRSAYNAARHMFGCRVKIFDPDVDIVTWWAKTHKYVMDTISAYVHHIQVGDFTPYDQINEDLISHILDFYDITDDISPKQILFTWSSSSK